LLNDDPPPDFLASTKAGDWVEGRPELVHEDAKP
jgi:hypothetical protein